MDEKHWILLLFYLVGSAATECLFPAEWRGTWYDSVLKTIEITGTSISQKGTCLQRDGNKFLMLNKGQGNRKCFKCIAFTQWHRNLLQYKESYCWHEESLDRVCGEINGDISLQTVVKVNSIPEPCPFQGSYTFSYANGTVEKCESPPSEIRECADESKFKFVYRHCTGFPGTHNQELDFQCLATWVNGEKFLYGKFSSPVLSPEMVSYRCFMHSFYGTTGDMAMSADPTCQGLQSPTLGVITMKLSKDMTSRFRGGCKFPSFLINQNKWRNLPGDIQMEVDDGLQVIRIKDRSPDDAILYTETFSSSDTRIVFKCVHGVGQTTYQQSDHDVIEVEYVARATNDSCVSEQKCLSFKKRSDGVIEVIVGNTLNTTRSTCSYDLGMKYLFIPENSREKSCPTHLSGVYQYTDKASDCHGGVNFGCRETEELMIDTKCPANRESVKILKCLQSWREDSSSYAIVKPLGETSNSMLCLTFIETEYGLEVQADTSCEGDRRVVINNYLNYLLYTPQEACNKDSEGLQADQNNSPIRVINSDNNTSPAASLRTSVFPCILSVLLAALCVRNS